MDSREAQIKLEIFIKLLTLNTNYNQCKPVISELYKLFLKFKNEL